MGWETLEQWGDDVTRIEPITGGVGVNEVWNVRVNGQLASVVFPGEYTGEGLAASSD